MKSQTALFLTFMLIILLISSCLKEEDHRTWEDEQKELEEYLNTNNITTEPTWTGLYYIEQDTGSGNNPEYYDTVVLEYRVSRLDGFLLESSENYGSPYIFPLFNNSVIYGLSEAVSYMKPGTSAKAIIPSKIALGGIAYEEIPPFTTLIYDLELIEIRPGIPVEPVNTDTLTLNTTSSGFAYYILKEDTTGKIVASWDYVVMHYTGYLTNGHIFFSTKKRNITYTTFFANDEYLPSGLKEGLVLMKEGEKFRFIIPPNLAYGEHGIYPNIPPNATLIYDVEVLEIL